MDSEREGSAWLSGLIMALMGGIFLYFRCFPFQQLLYWEWWIYRPDLPWGPGLFLSLLNHASWIHLLGNLLYFWTFAPSLEAFLGRPRFLLMFSFMGLMSNLVQGAVIQHFGGAQVGLGVVGASGAISGLMALFLLRFPSARIKTAWFIVSPLQGILRSGVILIPSLVAVVVWVLFQLLSAGASYFAGVPDLTAYGSHFGGLAAGLLLGYGLGLHRQGRRFFWQQRAQRAFNEGRWLGVIEAVQPLLPDAGPEELALAARAYTLGGHAPRARELYAQAVSRSLAAGDDTGAAGVYAEARRLFPDLVFPEAAQYRLAVALDRLGLPVPALAAIEAYRRLYRGSQRGGLLLLRQARIEEALDPDRARELYAEHQRRYPDSPFSAMVRAALLALGPAPEAPGHDP